MTIDMEQVCAGESRDYAPVRDILDRVCDKWSLMVMGMLENEPLRFTALLNAVPGISQRMLTLTLRNLERDGLVSREVFAQVPPRVEYTLTPLGVTLLPAVLAIAYWAYENHATVEANRDAFDEKRDSLALASTTFA